MSIRKIRVASLLFAMGFASAAPIPEIVTRDGRSALMVDGALSCSARR